MTPSRLARTTTFLLAAVVGPVVLASPASAATFHVPPSIDATGATDVTTDLLAFFDTVPDGTSKRGSRIEFPADAHYRIEGTLVLRDRHRLRFDGNGAEFFALTTGEGTEPWNEKPEGWPQKRSHWVLDGGSFITFDNIRVRGPNAAATYDPDLGMQAGFEIHGATDVTVKNCDVRDVHGEFVNVNNGAARVTVTGCVLSGAGRQGLGVNQGEDVVFAYNRLERVPRSAVNLEPMLDWAVRRVTVANNDFYPPVGNYLFANGGGGAASEDITWTDNRAHGLPFTVKAGSEARRARYVFSGNTSDTVAFGPAAVRFANIDGIVVHDNVIPTAPASFDIKGGVRDSGCWLELRSVTGEDVAGNDGGSGEVCLTE